MRLVVGCRRKHDDDDDEKEEECFVFALWCCLFCIRLVWVKWKNKRKKQLSEYQRQCHVFLTNESLRSSRKEPTRTINKPVRRGCEIIFPLGAYITSITKLYACIYVTLV